MGTDREQVKVVMYKKVPCPYCINAQRLLDEKGIKYDLVDLTDRPEELQALKEKTGWRTVPMIFVDDKLIGGYSDMKTLDEEGKLDTLVFKN